LAAKELKEAFLSSRAFCNCSTLVEVDLEKLQRKYDLIGIDYFINIRINNSISNLTYFAPIFYEWKLLSKGNSTYNLQ
jgi:hypothetical protein